MSIHESSINYRNLIRDLAEMYPQDVAEVIVVELIANALDAKAGRIEIGYQPGKRVLTVKDNGRGMSATEFEQYHDFAASLKTRGTGIGFAGVGAKISFNIAERVVTETRGTSFLGGSNWYFRSKKKLVWEDFKPSHLRGDGTRVEVWFKSGAKVPYSSRASLVQLIQRYYLPLLDRKFLDLYEKMQCYSSRLRFIVNGKVVKPYSLVKEFALDRTKEFFPKKRNKRIGYGILGIAPSEYPLGEDVAGVLLCTRGKVIKPELFNQFPSGLGPRIFGVVEVPDFVNYLTTAKTDFIRRGKHRELESLYDPIRQVFKVWLADLGVQQIEANGSDEGFKLERELRKILDEVPELEEFFGFRSPKSVLSANRLGLVDASIQSGSQITFPSGSGLKGKGAGLVDLGNGDGTALAETGETPTTKAKPISRTARRGPRVAFAKAPERVEVAWVEGNAVIINSGHPCYIKTQSNAMGRRLHNVYAIATTIQRFLGKTDEKGDLMFIDKMMAAWGKK